MLVSLARFKPMAAFRHRIVTARSAASQSECGASCYTRLRVSVQAVCRIPCRIPCFQQCAWGILFKGSRLALVCKVKGRVSLRDSSSTLEQLHQRAPGIGVPKSAGKDEGCFCCATWREQSRDFVHQMSRLKVTRPAFLAEAQQIVFP